jgi:hypothetical protein
LRSSEIDKEGKQRLVSQNNHGPGRRVASVLLDLNCVSAIRRGSFGPNDDSFFCWPSTPTLLHMAAGEEFINHSPHRHELLEAALDHWML